MLVRLRSNDLSGLEASSTGYMTNKLCSWNWKYFSRISDLEHAQNSMGSFQCPYVIIRHAAKFHENWPLNPIPMQVKLFFSFVYFCYWNFDGMTRSLDFEIEQVAIFFRVFIPKTEISLEFLLHAQSCASLGTQGFRLVHISKWIVSVAWSWPKGSALLGPGMEETVGCGDQIGNAVRNKFRSFYGMK